MEAPQDNLLWELAEAIQEGDEGRKGESVRLGLD